MCRGKMSGLQRYGADNNIIAILCSDLHLSQAPPVYRSEEENWLEAMTRPLNQLTKLAENIGCPVICAGDIFDKWNTTPEVINFAMKFLPQMYAIPGQHDLPYHGYKARRKSAYWTLVESGKIKNLKPKIPYLISTHGTDLHIYGHPFGHEIRANNASNLEGIHLCVAHEYMWVPGYEFRGAPNSGNLVKIAKHHKGRMGHLWNGYNVAHFGDNHKGFISNLFDTIIFNSGTFMIRHKNEKDYRPMVGLLKKDGTVQKYFLDTKEDKRMEIFIMDEEAEDGIDFTHFFNDLQKLESTAMDFTATLKQTLKKKGINKNVKEILERIIEEVTNET